MKRRGFILCPLLAIVMTLSMAGNAAAQPAQKKHHSGDHNEHTGHGASRCLHADLREKDGLFRQDHRRGLRPGHGHGRTRGGRRAPRSFPRCGEEVHGRRLRRRPATRHAQRLRHSRPAGRPGQDKGAQTGRGGLQEDGRPRPPFLSRGDNSGTNAKEKEIWKTAGINPGGRNGTRRQGWAWGRP